MFWTTTLLSVPRCAGNLDLDFAVFVVFPSSLGLDFATFLALPVLWTTTLLDREGKAAVKAALSRACVGLSRPVFGLC